MLCWVMESLEAPCRVECEWLRELVTTACCDGCNLELVDGVLVAVEEHPEALMQQRARVRLGHVRRMLLAQ